MDHRHPPRAVADPRGRPAGRVGREALDVEVQPARGVDREGPLAADPRARPAVPPASRPRLRVDRLPAVHAARRRPRGSLGGDRQDGVRAARLMDPLVVLFGFGVGILIGLTGIGGGSLMTPLLILVIGVQPVVAIGTDLAYGAITKTVGGWRHLRSGTVDLGVSKWMAFGSVPGSIAGVALIERLDLDVTVVLALVAAALTIVSLAVLARALFARAPRERAQVPLTARNKAGAVAI